MALVAGHSQATLFEVGPGKTYSTIQAAVDAAAALDVPNTSLNVPNPDPVNIVIYNGSYTENVSIPPDGSTSPNPNDRFNGYNDGWRISAAPGEKVWLTGGFDVAFERDSGVIDGINIKQTSTTGWGYNFAYLARSWAIKNGIIYQDGTSDKGGGRGELQYGATNYDHMTFFGTDYGVALNYAAWGTAKNSIFANINDVGISGFNSYGAPAKFEYSNSLFHNNGLDANGPSVENGGGNIFGLDPMFASTDPNSPDFLFLQPGSPAETSGMGGTYMGARGVAGPSSPEWALDGSGVWSVSGNWTGGVPNSIGAAAKLGAVITSGATISLDAPVVVGKIEFANSNSYTIAGPSDLTLSDGAGASLKVTAGSHAITANVTALSNTNIEIVPATSMLAITGSLSATGVNLTKSGAGTLQLTNVRSNALSVNGGTVQVPASGSANASTGASRVTQLIIAGGPAAPTAKLDLTNNALVIAYTGGSPQNDVRQLLLAAYAGGGWTGNGLTSTLAGGSPAMALGYADNTAIGKTTFAGQNANGSVIVAFTAAGDTNLDGKVNTIDFNHLAGSFGLGNQFWINGDFNYDGTVSSVDFGILSGNFGVTVPAGGPGLGQVVPEPTLASCLLTLGLLIRRRQGSRCNRCVAV